MSRLVDVIFSVTDEFSKPLKNFNTALEDVGRQGRQARKKIAELGNDLAKFGTGLTAGVTVPLTGLATSSYSTFETVDKQLALVEATMGEANYATADLYTALGDAAVNSIFSMEEGASALVNYARQGWNAAEAADMLAPALNLAAGTATDLDSVTSGLGNTMKAFGADSSQATYYVDQFTRAQAQANTDVQSLFEALSTAGPIAKTVGWEFADIGTLIGVFGDASISASEGANGLKTGLARLAKPPKQAAEALERLGIAESIFNQETGELLAMPELIGTLQDAFSGLSTQDALAAASDIFGKNQMDKWMALIQGPGPEALQEMRDNITGASGDAQAAADALVTPLEQLKSTFDVFKTTVGEVLSDVFVPLIDKATELVDVFRQLEPSQRENIVRFAGIAAAAGPVLLAFGKIVAFVPQIMAFGAAVGKAGGLAKFAFAAITSPAGIVVAALAGVVAAGILIYKNWDTIKEKAEVVWTYVQGVFEKLKDKLSPITTALQGAFTDIANAFAQAKEELAPHIEAFTTAFGQLRDELQPVFDKIGEIIGAVTTAVGDFIGTFVDGQIAAVAGDVTTLGDAISTHIGGAADILGGVLDAMTSIITYLTGDFKTDWSSTWETVGSVFDTIAGGIASLLGTIGDKLSSVGQGLANLKNAAAEKWDNSALNWKNWGGEGNASGTSYWKGGPTRVNESGGEIINLPSGTQIIPHDASRNTAVGTGSVNIAKLADSIIVREDADIDRITDSLVRKLIKAQDNMGVVSPA